MFGNLLCYAMTTIPKSFNCEIYYLIKNDGEYCDKRFYPQFTHYNHHLLDKVRQAVNTATGRLLADFCILRDAYARVNTVAKVLWAFANNEGQPASIQVNEYHHLPAKNNW